MSTLREAVREYLAMRRGLGFKLHDAGKLLLKFVTFMEQHHASYITPRLALAWAQQPPSVQPVEWAHRLSAVRTFARHRSATDPRTEIPPDGLLPLRPKRARPYLSSNQEIKALLRAALALPSRGRLRPWTYHCLFGLLSVSGLRLGEVRNLELQDVDLRVAVLTIRGSKFGKSRLVPLHTSTRDVARELPQTTPPAVGDPAGFVLRVRIQPRESVRSRRDPPNLLCVVSTDRLPGSLRSSRAASARPATPIRRDDALAGVPLRQRPRTPLADSVRVPRPCACQ